MNEFLALHSECTAWLANQNREDREKRKRQHEERVEEIVKLFEGDIPDYNVRYLRSFLRDSGQNFRSSSEEYDLQEMEPKMEVHYKEFDTKDSGRPDEVLERLNTKQVKMISLEFGQVWDHRNLGLRIHLNQAGASAVLAGPQTLVNGAATTLKSLFGQQKPRTAWIRDPWFLIPFCFITSTVFSYFLTQRLFEEGQAEAGWLSFFAVPLLFWLQWYGFRWLVPPFELIPNGTKSRSQFAVATIGAIVIGVLSTLFSELFLPL